jgi:predicted dehydrogenase
MSSADRETVSPCEMDGLFPVVTADRPRSTLPYRHVPTTVPRGPLDSIVIGFGRAGDGLHTACIRKAAELHGAAGVISGLVVHVERDEKRRQAACGPTFSSIAQVQGVQQENAVVHVATQASERLACVKEALKCGYRLFVLEKPLGSCHRDLEEMETVITASGAVAVVNYPWLATPLTDQLHEMIMSDQHGFLQTLAMTQVKPRTSRSDQSGSALDVETPHQISLALYLAGKSSGVIESSTVPLAVDGASIPHWGGATVLLRQGRTVSFLRSDLNAVSRERRIHLIFENGYQVVGWYPPDGNDPQQVLCVFDDRGRLISEQRYHEDPMGSLLIRAYRHFLGLESSVVSGFQLALATERVLTEARRVAGVELTPIPSRVGWQ